MKWLDRWRRAEEPPADPAEREALDALLERARALPREAQPERDLWLGIRNRIELEQSATRASARPGLWGAKLSVPVWAASAAAVLLVALTVGTGLWLSAPPSLDDPAAIQALADSLRDRDGVSGVHRDLLALLDERRAQLPPEVVAAVERNLAEIDRAITEIHVAFEEHPDNPALQFLLAEAYRREADMLAQLESWTSPRAPEVSS
ncbi:MAG: hypothetical protein ABFS41_00030 [Myxococcota bacterium]